MEESGSLCKPQKFLLSESDMATAATAAAVVAAQQLMQLSYEDNNSSENSSNIKTKKKSLDDDDEEEEEDYVQSKEEMSWAKTIQKIFGKEDEEVIYQPRKRRYRTLVSLYRATKPMPLDMYRKKTKH